MEPSWQHEEDCRACWQPSTDADRQAVRDQLQRLLRDPLFANSKRYPALLSYVIEKTLRRESADLKERTIGIEALGRNPDYDTNADTVVRVAAGEIRKRLAQYYIHNGHENEIEVELPLGSYRPEFRLPPGKARPSSEYAENPLSDAAAPQARPGTEVSDTPLTPVFSSSHNERSPHRSSQPKRWVSISTVAAICAVLALTALLIVRARGRKEHDFAKFWSPVTASHKDPLLCIGDRASYNAERIAIGEPPVPDTQVVMGSETIAQAMKSDALFSMNTVDNISHLGGTLQSLHRSWHMVNAYAANLTDMRENPTVLVGFNNLWTVRVLSQLRYSFRMEKGGGVIFDQQTPSKLHLTLPLDMPFNKEVKDYGIVARLREPSFGQPVLVVAGLGEMGTNACVEEVSNPEFLAELLQKAPQNWESMNMETVLSTEVIDGKSGRPRIEAVYWW